MRVKMPTYTPTKDKWLPNVPGLTFYPDSGYFFCDQPIPHRLTEVVSKNDYFDRIRTGEYGKSKQKDLEESLKFGNVHHDCLNAHFRGRSYYSQPFQKSVQRLIDDDIWKVWDVIGSEYRMVDLRRGISGTADLILKHKKDKNRFAIADLKTKKRAYVNKNNKPRMPHGNHKSQVGGYINLLNLTWPELTVEDCFVIYASPNMVDIQYYDWFDCLTDYEAIRSLFFDNLAKIDPSFAIQESTTEQEIIIEVEQEEENGEALF